MVFDVPGHSCPPPRQRERLEASTLTAMGEAHPINKASMPKAYLRMVNNKFGSLMCVGFWTSHSVDVFFLVSTVLTFGCGLR
jgi:hypothetical protein